MVRCLALSLSISIGLAACDGVPDRRTVERKLALAPHNTLISVRKTCPIAAAHNYYFPDGTFDARSSADTALRSWYSGTLREMDELSLSCGAAGDVESYRFLYLRSFLGPVLVHAERRDDSYSITTVEVVDWGQGTSGDTTNLSRRDLSSHEWSAIRRAISDANFWNTQTKRANSPFGLDGSRWILEGRATNRYHVVDRWSPQAGPHREACMKLLDVGQLTVGELY